MGLRLSIEVLIAPIIGGLGSLFGPIVGAFFVVPLMEASNVLGQSTGLFGLNTLIYGVVILLCHHLPARRHLAAGRAPSQARGSASDADVMLAVRNLTKAFRGLVAVKDVSFEVRQGEILAVIGPNGAGKTTCFNLIAGALKPTSGRSRVRRRAHFRADARRDRRPRRDPYLPDRAADARHDGAGKCHDRRLLPHRERERRLRHRDRRRWRASACAAKADMSAAASRLPDRKMLELARAVAAQPKLLLLDEVMAGPRPSEGDQIVAAIKDLHASGITVLLIEHVMRVVMALGAARGGAASRREDRRRHAGRSRQRPHRASRAISARRAKLA